MGDTSPSVQDTASFRPKRPAPRGTAAYPRKRAVTACQVCRARRTKCDNAKPVCGFRRKTGAKCIQSAVDLSSFDPASLRILERLDELETVVKAVGQSDEHRTTPGDVGRPSVVPGLERLLPYSLEKLLPEVDGVTSPSLMRILQAGPRDLAALSPTSPLSIVADLEARTAKALLDNFFNYVHVKNPILQEEATRRLVAGICLQGVEWTAESCLALLVCALGACATPFGDSTDIHPGSLAYVQAQSYFKAAQKRLGLCMASPGIVEAQCLFLAGVYLMHVFQPFDAWRFFSQALACCQGFDFLTQEAFLTVNSAPDCPNYSTEQQAIYWSAWKSEQEMRWSLEPPDFMLPAAPQSLYPIFFPTPPPPSEADTSRQADTAYREQFSWYFYLTEISLRRLSSRMADDMLTHLPQTGIYLRSLTDALPEREAELAAWVDALPALMRLDTHPDLDDVCKFVIRGHVANVHEMLYWPFLLPYIDSNTDLEPSMIEEGTRPLAETALQKHVDRIWLNRPGFKHRHHGTWPMIRSCSRSAMVLIKCAANGGLHMPGGWRDAVQEVVELNRFWQMECPDAYHRLPLMEHSFSEVEIGHHLSGDGALTSPRQ